MANENRVLDILNNTDCSTCAFKPTCNFLKYKLSKDLCEALNEDMKESERWKKIKLKEDLKDK